MEGYELVKRAIEFEMPERLPFFQHEVKTVPDDVCDCWEMDRARQGWFFDQAVADDWGCGWAATDKKNMGQVVSHPLEDWSKLDGYKPPDPKDPYYFDRIEAEMAQAGNRYVIVTSHFHLIERLHMLHGFSKTLEDLYMEPEKIEKALDMILEFKLEQLHELHRRFGNRIHGIFTTDDWGTQEGTYINGATFKHFFLDRYKKLAQGIHGLGWHYFLHSCGKINDFIPYFIEAGIDVLNMQQPQTNGIKEIGRQFAGKIGFLTTADIQCTLPLGDPKKIREEVRELVENWSTPKGGFIVFNYGNPEALGVDPAMTEIMFQAFKEMM